jgi:hypothetical protein
MTTDTRVKRIQLKNLPAATFQPPAGFYKEQPNTSETRQNV